MRLDCASIVTRGTGFVQAEVDGEIVALNIEKGMCYGLNEVGSRIWALIGEPVPVAHICDALVAEYAVDRATCEQEVLDVLEDLRSEGMVEQRPAPAGAG